MAVNLKNKFKEKVMPELMKKLGYSNIHEVPHIEKIVVNFGMGEAMSDN